MRVNESFWKTVFTLASFYGFAAAFAVTVSYIYFPSFVFSLDGLRYIHNLAFDTLWYALVLIIVLYGLGYYAVSRDLHRNRALIWLGIGGKFGFAILVFRLYIGGVLTLQLPVALLGDIVWATLFADFLRRTRHSVVVSHFVG